MPDQVKEKVVRPGPSAPSRSRRDAALCVPIGRRAVKRAVDLAVAIPLAVLTIPFVLMLMLCSTIAFRSWPLFMQQRIGRYGKPFTMVKIRSLAASTSASADKYELQRLDIGRFGRFVRSTHLDELPQLWLVISGRMSMIGHRPEMPHLDAMFRDEQRVARDAFRPGCSGPWQLSADAGGLMLEYPEYDLWYAEQQSLRLDIYLMLKTVTVHAGGPKLGLERVPQLCVSQRQLEPAKA